MKASQKPPDMQHPVAHRQASANIHAVMPDPQQISMPSCQALSNPPKTHCASFVHFPVIEYLTQPKIFLSHAVSHKIMRDHRDPP